MSDPGDGNAPGPAPADAEAIRTRLAAVESRIETACVASGRDRAAVRLLLATKTVDPQRVRVAIEAGANLVAENRVQEVRPKYEALTDLNYERHFIGHLQSNKINALVPYVSCIQSLDRLSLARKLKARRARSCCRSIHPVRTPSSGWSRRPWSTSQPKSVGWTHCA
jgi:uncharacterized pyridoxal phosphate-containing UPF0001 family protein